MCSIIVFVAEPKKPNKTVDNSKKIAFKNIILDFNLMARDNFSQIKVLLANFKRAI